MRNSFGLRGTLMLSKVMLRKSLPCESITPKVRGFRECARKQGHGASHSVTRSRSGRSLIRGVYMGKTCFRSELSGEIWLYTWCENYVPGIAGNFMWFCFLGTVEKGLKADTVKAYLSSINVAHNFRGLESHCSNVIIASMLKGAKNMSLYEGLTRGTRKVMSYPLMKLLQHQIFNAEWSDDSKLVVWAASLTAYFGSLETFHSL